MAQHSAQPAAAVRASAPSCGFARHSDEGVDLGVDVHPASAGAYADKDTDAARRTSQEIIGKG